MTHPDWARAATVYQINTRQFTPEGTLRAAAEQLPRLQRLGVTILWLMPVQPIGEKNRKGELGSPYSVQDYYGLNPEFGTHDDLRAFVDRAHELGLYVILDWVANHTDFAAAESGPVVLTPVARYSPAEELPFGFFTRTTDGPVTLIRTIRPTRTFFLVLVFQIVPTAPRNQLGSQN